MPDVAVDVLLRVAFEGQDTATLSFDDLFGFRDQVTVHLTVLGTTNAGLDVTSNEFSFDIEVCFGCLVSCPPESGDVESGIPLCENPESPSVSSCFLGQDEVFDCRYCVPLLDGETCRRFCE